MDSLPNNKICHCLATLDCDDFLSAGTKRVEKNVIEWFLCEW